MKKRKHARSVTAWAWEIRMGSEWLLCKWSEPNIEALLMSRKPSPEARAVPVRMTEVVARKRKGGKKK